MPKLYSRALLLLLLVLALPACRREAVAPGDPVAAVKALADALHDDDLVRYSKLSMPPELHKRVEQRWHQRLLAAAPPTAEQQRDYARWMQGLTADGAEQRMYARYDQRMKKMEPELRSQWPMMQATGGIFINGLVKASERMSAGEKEHARAVGAALLAWLKPEMLTDRARARQAIAVFASTARELELPTLESTRQLEMQPALEKGGELLKAAKRVGRIYGLDFDASLAQVDARLVAASGDGATVQVSYPLLDQTVRFQMRMLRRGGRWYPADAVQAAERDLAQPLLAGGKSP